MRYRDGEIPAELLTKNASNEMLLFTAVIGLFIGIALIWLGRHGKQMWMWTWGIGLVFCSIYMWFGIRFDFKPFGYF